MPGDRLQVCPLEKAQKWTGTENPGAFAEGGNVKWDWALLCDLSHIADSNPTTIKENVKMLLKAIDPSREEKDRLIAALQEW